jgi:acyl-CoA synthetase (AMP-forming)/AMP-acid ligase II
MPVPLFHATGCHSILVANASFGGTLVFMRKWDPEVALDLIEREGVTNFSGVPAMTWELVNAPSLDQRDLTTLVNVGGGGAAAPPELVRRTRDRLPGRGIGTGYGLTETSSLVTSISGADYVAHPDSVGVPVPVCEVRIVDDDGADVAPGERGEVWIKGPNVVPGYWQRPEETARTFTGGWLHSGDIGRFDSEGYLYIVDRAKDIIIRGGENVSSAEVEAALFEHHDVADAAVIGVPHQVLGEEVGAVICFAPGATRSIDDLRAHLVQRLATFKVPAHFFVTEEPLPRNPAGKVLKRALRERFVPAGDGGDAGS